VDRHERLSLARVFATANFTNSPSELLCRGHSKVESTLLIVDPLEGYFTPNGIGGLSKTGEGVGCYGTGFKGSIFPYTYLEWDAIHNSTIEIGSTIKLGEQPTMDYFAPQPDLLSG